MTTTSMTPERLAEIQEVTTRWFNKKDLKESSREYFALVLELTAEVHRLQGELAKVEKERDVLDAEHIAEDIRYASTYR